LGRIDLLLIDEVHHIHEDRGAILEIVCVRMRTLSQAYKLRTPEKNDQTNLRIVALSATLPNVSDIGEWLNCSHENVHFFDDTFRPVPLDLHVLGL
jgi:replicative superfamily II helicase